MIHHYFFIYRLAEELGVVLRDASLIAAFSQQKDELILELELKNGLPFFIRAELQQGVGLLSFPESFQRSRANAADLFPEITGKKNLLIKPVLFDRSFHLVFENGLQLCFKLYGNRGNVLLHNGTKILRIFNQHLKKDLESVPPSDLNELLPHFGKYSPDSQILKLHHPMLGKEDWMEWERRKKQKPEAEEKVLFRDFLHQLSEGKLFVCLRDNMAVTSVFPKEGILLESYSPMEIANRYQRAYWTINRFEQDKKTCLGAWEKKQIQIREQIYATETQINKQTASDGFKIQADLLMAYAGQIPKGAEGVKLPLFGEEKDIEIQLKKDLSVIDNANRLYRKAKGEKENLKQLEVRLGEWKENLKQNETICKKIQDAAHWSELKPFINVQGLSTQDVETQPYHLRSFMNFDIWIGKNARANDEMLRLAHKDDYWLHARDTAGSHVIIRKNKATSLPKPVLEKAAQWAAYYSKSKTESLVAVVFTEKKYVRKSKGMLSGQVKIEREKTLLVRPQMD
jgi:predicted ribosome quality control (RQC) complex YloA/Tae2 family protein